MSATIRPRRSALFVPATNARALTRARSVKVDMIIIDLEDAVAPDAKEDARQAAVAALSEGGYGRREVIVRINGLETSWAAADIAAIAAAGPDAILVPKVSRAEDLRRVRAALAAASASSELALWAMMETPLAILNAAAIAAASEQPGAPLAGFVVGTHDLAKETGARQVPGRAPMLAWITSCVVAARAFGLEIVDGVFGDLRDMEGFRAECEQGRDLGMDGKSLIHPKQVEICNEVFMPSPDELAWARTVTAAFDKPENANVGVMAIEGQMVERLHAVAARRVLARADAIAALEDGSGAAD